MEKLLRSPIAARTQGVLPPGARRAVDARARPNGTGPALSSPRTLPARPGVVLLWQFASQFARIALDPTSLRFFMNNPG